MLLVYISLDELFVHTNSLKFTPEQTYGTEAIQCYRQTNCKVELLKLLSGCNNNLDCCSTVNHLMQDITFICILCDATVT